MHNDSDSRMARHIEAIYNYNVGQRAAVGRLLLWIFCAVCLVFVVASTASTCSQIAAGLIHMQQEVRK